MGCEQSVTETAGGSSEILNTIEEVDTPKPKDTSQPLPIFPNDSTSVLPEEEYVRLETENQELHRRLQQFQYEQHNKIDTKVKEYTQRLEKSADLLKEQLDSTQTGMHFKKKTNYRIKTLETFVYPYNCCTTHNLCIQHNRLPSRDRSITKADPSITK